MSAEVAAGGLFGLAGLGLLIKAFREKKYVEVPAYVYEVQERTGIQFGGNPVLAWVTIEYFFEGKWHVVKYKFRGGGLNFFDTKNLDSIYIDPNDREKFVIPIEKAASIPLGILLMVVSFVCMKHLV